MVSDPKSPVRVAVDTNFLLDLAKGKEDPLDVVQLIRKPTHESPQAHDARCGAARRGVHRRMFEKRQPARVSCTVTTDQLGERALPACCDKLLQQISVDGTFKLHQIGDSPQSHPNMQESAMKSSFRDPIAR